MTHSPAQPDDLRNEVHNKALEAQLALWWQDILGRDHVGLHEDFFQLGGGPEKSAILLEKIKLELRVVIRGPELYEARTISKLSDLIQIRLSAREHLCIVPIRAKGKRRPLFLVHGVGGNILGFAGLARSLHEDQPVYGIQAQALNNESPTLIRLEAMAQFYIEELRRVQPTGPYALLGFSFGGLVAYEIAQQLTRAGEQVGFLGMLDTWQPGYLKLAKASQPRLLRVWNRLQLMRLNTRKLSLAQLIPYSFRWLKGRILRAAYQRMPSTASVNLPDSMRRVEDINTAAGMRYVVQPYPGRLTLFRANDEEGFKLPEDLGWRAHAPDRVDILHLPGDHGQILAEPNVSFMATHIEDCLVRPLQGMAGQTEVRDEFELADDGVVNLVPDPVRREVVFSTLSAPIWSADSVQEHFGARRYDLPGFEIAQKALE